MHEKIALVYRMNRAMQSKAEHPVCGQILFIPHTASESTAAADEQNEAWVTNKNSMMYNE